ncbi:diguanylate cyclase [Sulfurimonas sp. SAG-AH-194-I05]|nr:diguanylate cyclase [Sulfurimonas sp. SAG-AH-194-I05]MDF1874745.1 diguanylate cyclase [Sulfurimonas sp. SAG-AH-194-I05]
MRNTNTIELLAKSYHATQDIQSKNRNTLKEELKEQYKTAKKQGVLQLHIVNKDTISFLRMHKPNKFGDDLTEIRPDFKYTNETKKALKVFTQGRVAHGFRNVFPIFDKNNIHIGAIEISFSSDRFEWYLNNISKIHTHFLINKNIFDVKAWERKDLVVKYKVSAENKNFMLSFLYFKEDQCIDRNILKKNHVKKEIALNMIHDKSFNVFAKDAEEVIVASFLPVKNMQNKTVAWIVTYKHSPILHSVFLVSFILQIVVFLLSLIIIFLLKEEILSKKKIQRQKEKAEIQTQKIEKKDKELQKQYDLFNEVLNSTNNILFITDFKNVLFSNEKFKNLLKIEKRKKYATQDGTFIMHCVYKENCPTAPTCKKNFNILDLFIVVDGFLHKELLQENESFVSLIKRTEEKNRIVSMMNSDCEAKAFTIDITPLKNAKECLVSLSDITEIKEDLVVVHKKAYIDGLTQVYNRNKFDELFEEEFKRSKRYKEPFALAIIDIDKFKNFNDTYGHLLGDEVLILMAQTLNASVRETDVFARWGGEEFVVLFKNTSLQAALEVSLKLKDKIEANEHKTAGRITASFGLTAYKDGDTQQSIFKRCDDALYLAKKNGRNRVESV